MTSPADQLRIGGEFELSVDELAQARPAIASAPTFGRANEIWLDTGRSALAIIASHLLQVAPRSTVWLPAYSCESIARPFERRSLPVHFYAVGPALDRFDVEPEAGDTVLLIHYFGFRNVRALARIDELRSHGVRVIEDCVQAAFTSGLGVKGDYSVTSLRKLLVQPDGALLSSREALHAAVDAPDEAFVSARALGKIIRGRGATSECFLPLFGASEARLADDHPRAMSWLARRLLAATDLGRVAERRRANFERLVGRLGELPSNRVRPLMSSLDDGEVPLGLPVVVASGERDALRRHLAQDNVFCPVHWDLPHVERDHFVAEHALSASILTLPIDQRYDAGDMATIFHSLKSFLGANA